jgi:putative nucleotidyltransferase with HDIG domain
MRQRGQEVTKKYKIAVLDDDIGIVDSLRVVLRRNGYDYCGYTDPKEATQAIKDKHFDMLILDYLMGATRGDEVVKMIREFNEDLYILLLTGHKDIVPPLDTIRALDIQGYCEKSNKFDQLILLVESGIKAVNQIQTIRSLNKVLENAYEEIRNRYVETIEALRLAVDAKDKYTKGHSDRVSYYAVKVGEAFNLEDRELEILKTAGVFHDLGKIGTSDDILFKTEKLEKDEYETIKKHTVKGAEILEPVNMFKDVIPIVKYHHERIDGKGYPEGIPGDKIPFLARILSVVDAFDAMVSDRIYRKRLTIDEAKEQLTLGSGTQFDGEIVKVFLELLKDHEEILRESN